MLQVIACSAQENETTTKEEVKEEVNETVETVKAYTIEEKDELLEQFEAKRDQTKTQIDEMRMKLDSIKKIICKRQKKR